MAAAAVGRRERVSAVGGGAARPQMREEGGAEQEWTAVGL